MLDGADEPKALAHLILILAVTELSPVIAQTFGEITGNVTDSTAGSVAAARVTITNIATRQVRQTDTNEAGGFTVPFLAPGIYQVKVEKEGFKSVTRGGVQLQVADSVRVNFSIEVGSVSESIEVQGSASLLTTENGTVGTVIDNRQ